MGLEVASSSNTDKAALDNKSSDVEMDHCAAICLAFPPENLNEQDDAAFDKAINQQLVNLSKLMTDSKQALVTHGTQLLDLINPAVHSLSYLAVLHSLLLPNITGPRDKILESLVTFLVAYDGRQMRYAGTHLLDILSLVGSGSVLPPSIAVQVLSDAILRLDPTGSMLTTTHITLARLAYHTDSILPAVLQVIDKSIVFYPGMANHGEAQYSCDMTLPPHKYISKKSGHTALLKPQNIMEYDLLCGLMYCAQRDWAKAYAAFERIITYPTREHGTSKMMTEAYKKWVLVSLFLKGKTSSLPAYAGASAKKAYDVLGKPYTTVASCFETVNAEGLKAEAEKSLQTWQDDSNLGLMQEVLAAYQKWQVLNLRDVYAKVSITEVRRQTKSAQTGDILNKDEDVEALIQNMIISGMLSGVIGKNDDGTSFLSFLPPSTIFSEQALATELAQTALRLKSLEAVFKSTSERIGTSKEYIKHLVKEQKRGDKGEHESTLGFDTQVDDEDLMGGINPT